MPVTKAPIFEDWISNQTVNEGPMGELSRKLVASQGFTDFYSGNSLSDKVEWMFSNDYPQREVITLIRGFEQWVAWERGT